MLFGDEDWWGCLTPSKRGILALNLGCFKNQKSSHQNQSSRRPLSKTINEPKASEANQSKSILFLFKSNIRLCPGSGAILELVRTSESQEIQHIQTANWKNSSFPKRLWGKKNAWKRHPKESWGPPKVFLKNWNNMKQQPQWKHWKHYLLIRK